MSCNNCKCEACERERQNGQYTPNLNLDEIITVQGQEMTRRDALRIAAANIPCTHGGFHSYCPYCGKNI